MTPALDTLSRTLWGEARDQGLDGMAAVASVVLNRVHIGGWWGKDIFTVCRMPHQFSCWSPDDPNRVKLEKVTLADPQFQDAVMIARDAIAGELRDRTYGATLYYSPKSMNPPGSVPSWASEEKKTVQIGDQIFYKS